MCTPRNIIIIIAIWKLPMIMFTFVIFTREPYEKVFEREHNCHDVLNNTKVAARLWVVPRSARLLAATATNEKPAVSARERRCQSQSERGKTLSTWNKRSTNVLKFALCALTRFLKVKNSVYHPWCRYGELEE